MLRNKILNLEDLLMGGILLVLIGAVMFAVAFSVIAGDPRLLFPFIVILCNLSLGVFVYLRGRRQRINLSFCLMSIFVAAWALAVFMYSDAQSIETALLWSRIAAASSSMIPAIFVYFASVFPKENRIPSPGSVIFWFAAAFIFSCLGMTDIMVKDAVNTLTGFQFIPGPGLVFFMFYFLAFMAYAFYRLFRSHSEYTGISRMQIRYVVLGFFLGISFPIATNLILPLFGVVEFSGYGPFFSIITIAFIAYAIVRHRLMSIELVMQSGFIYVIVTACIMAMYAVAILLSERIFRERVGYSSFFVTALSAALIALFFQPFVKALQDLTNRVFFRGHYDYQRTLRDASSAISSIIRLDDLTGLIVKTFTETMRVSEISFLIHDRGKKRYRSAPVELSGESRYRQMEIDESSPVITYLKNRNDIVIRDEIESRISRTKSDAEKKLLNDILDEIARVGSPLWVPITSKDELVGVIVSGNKLSGEIFTTDDLGLILTLANQTALALENTRLYEEIVSMKNYNEDILKSMTNGVLTTDLKGRVITFNSMAEAITGYQSAEVSQKTASSIWESGAIPGALDAALRGQEYHNHESSIIKKDGSVVPISLSTTLLRSASRKTLGVLAVISDLSEVKELEGKVRQADKLAALGTMAAGMAHEIKNPLSSMKVLSQLLPLKFSDDTFRKRFEEIMPREIGRIDRIVESLLGFARATAPKFEQMQISSVIEEALGFFADDIEKRGIKLIKKFDPVPNITVDPGQISQVFSNLLLNAIQAMPEGGELNVSIGEGEKKDAVLKSVLIKVSDTGHGIPRESLGKLFDPFFTTKHGGTGLGLTIAHSIVDGHRGEISVSSEIEKGTEFSVTLPITQ